MATMRRRPSTPRGRGALRARRCLSSSLSQVAVGWVRRGRGGRSRCGESRAPARGSRERAAVSRRAASVARPALRPSPCRPRAPLALLRGRPPPQRAGGRTPPARAALPCSAPAGRSSPKEEAWGRRAWGAEGPRPGRVGRLPRPDGGVRSRSASIPRLGKGNPALLCLCTAAFRHGVAPSRGLGRRSFPGRAAPGCPACPGAERARLSPGCGAAPRPCHALPPPTRRPLLSGSK